MSAYATVREAFYSGAFDFTGDPRTVRDIAFLVDENYLELTTFPIASRKEYEDTLRLLERPAEGYEAAGGSAAHVALKQLTARYLQTVRKLKIKYEHPFCGYYPDVLTVEARVVAECGHTNNPEKMLAYFRQGDIEECILVPYPDFEAETVFAHSFTALPNLKDFLIFWEQEKHTALQTKLKGSS